jgi:hypothetical protein
MEHQSSIQLAISACESIRDSADRQVREQLLSFCWQFRTAFDKRDTACLPADQALELFYLGPDCQGEPAHQQLPKTVSAAAVRALVAGVDSLLAHEAAPQRGIVWNGYAAQDLWVLLLCNMHDMNTAAPQHHVTPGSCLAVDRLQADAVVLRHQCQN